VSFAADCLGGDENELGNEYALCGRDYTDDCQCPGPTQDGYEYEERDGILFGRLVQPVEPGLEGLTRAGDKGDQPRREHTVKSGPASAPGAVDAWSDYELIPCLDGKSRRVESGVAPLAPGLPRGVVPSGDPGVQEAKETGEARVMRLKGYGNSINTYTAKVFIEATFLLDT
jgi:hypothetical protein